MINEIERLDVLCKEIGSNPDTSGGGTMSCPSQVVYVNLEKSQKNLIEVKSQGVELREALIGLYSKIVRIEIEWKPREAYFDTPIELLPEDKELFPEAEKDVKEAVCSGRPSLTGHIRIETLPNLINGPKGKKWKDILWFDEMDVEEKEYWQQFMVFDYSVPECLILLKKTGNVVEDKLYYHYKDNDKAYELNIGIEKYLDIAYKVKGFEGWQYALAKRSSNYEYILKRMKHYLPQIFPKLTYDFSDFE
ncbi:MAG: hypothetical protein JST49_00535 [Bacteroidetes bacterium]|nr:hypothetical protein [Bacteroidota bacterium]